MVRNPLYDTFLYIYTERTGPGGHANVFYSAFHFTVRNLVISSQKDYDDYDSIDEELEKYPLEVKTPN